MSDKIFAKISVDGSEFRKELAELTKDAEKFADAEKEISKESLKSSATLRNAVGSYDNFKKSLSDAVSNSKSFKEALGKLEGAHTSLRITMQRLEKSGLGNSKFAQSVKANMEIVQRAIDSTKSKVDSTASSVEKLNKSGSDKSGPSEGLSGVSSSIKGLGGSLEKLLPMAAKALPIVGSLGTAFGVLGKIIMQNDEYADKFNTTLAGTKAALQEVANQISQGGLSDLSVNMAVNVGISSARQEQAKIDADVNEVLNSLYSEETRQEIATLQRKISEYRAGSSTTPIDESIFSELRTRIRNEQDDRISDLKKQFRQAYASFIGIQINESGKEDFSGLDDLDQITARTRQTLLDRFISTGRKSSSKTGAKLKEVIDLEYEGLKAEVADLEARRDASIKAVGTLKSSREGISGFAEKLAELRNEASAAQKALDVASAKLSGYESVVKHYSQLDSESSVISLAKEVKKAEAAKEVALKEIETLKVTLNRAKNSNEAKDKKGISDTNKAASDYQKQFRESQKKFLEQMEILDFNAVDDNTVRDHLATTAEVYMDVVQAEIEASIARNKNIFTGNRFNQLDADFSKIPEWNRELSPSEALQNYRSQLRRPTVRQQALEVDSQFVSELGSINGSVESLYDTFKNFDKIENPFQFFDSLVGTAQQVITIIQTLDALSTTMKEMSAVSAAISLENQENSLSEAGTSAAAAAAETTKQNAKLGPWGWVAGITAAGIIVATLLSMRSRAKKYAYGGFVGGSQYTGDHVMVAANSGELILNQNEQAVVRSLTGGGGRQNVHITGELTAKGRDLKLVLDNENKLTQARR